MVTSQILLLSVTPVVLISSCGLITLALYNRLGTILARIRAFHHQKIELLEALNEKQVTGQLLLIQMLDSQMDGVTIKARTIQKGLSYLLASIAAFLFCSLFSGVSVIFEWVGIVAIGCGFIGTISFLLGICWAMKELNLSLTPLEEERVYLELLTTHHLEKPQSLNGLKIA